MTISGITMLMVTAIFLIVCIKVFTRLYASLISEVKDNTVGIKYCGKIQQDYGNKFNEFKKTIKKRFDSTETKINKTNNLLETICKKL